MSKVAYVTIKNWVRVDIPEDMENEDEIDEYLRREIPELHSCDEWELDIEEYED